MGLETLEVGEADCSDGVSGAKRRRVKTCRRVGKLNNVACCKVINIDLAYLKKRTTNILETSY
jgi:hypothetical protein